MDFTVGSLWVIYIGVVVVVFIIFGLCLSWAKEKYNSVGYGTAFFIASLLGAIAVFIGAAWLDPNQLTSTDKTWLSVLFLVAFLMPVFVIFYIVWAGEYASFTGEEDCMPKCFTKQTIHCDRDTGMCHIKKKKMVNGDDVTKIKYSSHKEPQEIIAIVSQ